MKHVIWRLPRTGCGTGGPGCREKINRTWSHLRGVIIKKQAKGSASRWMQYHTYAQSNWWCFPFKKNPLNCEVAYFKTRIYDVYLQFKLEENKHLWTHHSVYAMESEWLPLFPRIPSPGTPTSSTFLPRRGGALWIWCDHLTCKKYLSISLISFSCT